MARSAGADTGRRRLHLPGRVDSRLLTLALDGQSCHSCVHLHQRDTRVMVIGDVPVGVDKVLENAKSNADFDRELKAARTVFPRADGDLNIAAHKVSTRTTKIKCIWYSFPELPY
jgi:hypothetical protein